MSLGILIILLLVDSYIASYEANRKFKQDLEERLKNDK